MSEAKYLQIMRTVLRGAYEILSNEGSIYVHIDYRMSAKIRGILDKIFGESNFQNEIIWAYNSGGRAKHFSRVSTIIFWFIRGRARISILKLWASRAEPLSATT